jgi:hypothetical protein
MRWRVWYTDKSGRGGFVEVNATSEEEAVNVALDRDDLNIESISNVDGPL